MIVPEDLARRPVVQETIGPSLSASEAAGAIALGTLSLLMVGVMPALLGALADDGRLSAAGIGQCAMLEGLTMGLAAGFAGIVLKPKRLRLIGAIAAAALAVLDIASIHASHMGVFVARGLAGLPEGVLLWITVGMIARSETPERWAGVFFTAIVSAQLVLAFALAVAIMPRFGVEGGFATLALTALAGIPIAFYAPRFYAALPATAQGESGAPPLRGWIALLATLIYTSAGGAVVVYLQPMAHEAGLNADVARTALWVSLAAQVAGGTMATLLAGHVKYFTVFAVSSVIYIGSWALFTVHPPAWLFIAANASFGFVLVLIGPFLVPMTIEADPSRRAAMQSASVQVLAGALGPLLASLVVDDHEVFGVLFLGAGLILSGLAVMAYLHFSAQRERRLQSPAN